MRYADTLKNIFEFILNVRKQAGFDLKPNAGSPGRDIMLDKTIRMDWFAQISETPGVNTANKTTAGTTSSTTAATTASTTTSTTAGK